MKKKQSEDLDIGLLHVFVLRALEKEYGNKLFTVNDVQYALISLGGDVEDTASTLIESGALKEESKGKLRISQKGFKGIRKIGLGK